MLNSILDSKNLNTVLESIIIAYKKEIDMGLSRMQGAMDKLNLSFQGSPRFVLVGGTNGKGSVINLLNQFLITHNYKTALYTSPHILSFRERLKFNQGYLDEKSWLEAIEKIKSLNLKLTFFELTTLASFYLCSQTKLDFILLEVGLGGRLDATNIIDADMAILTNIDLDHQEYLGNTLNEIGQEKAGIFRINQKIILGDSQFPQSVFDKIENLQNNYYQLNKDFYFNANGDYKHCIKGQNIELKLNSNSNLKLENIATAIFSSFILMQDEFADYKAQKFDSKQVSKLIDSFHFTGRVHKISKFYAQMDLIFDVAHNQAGINYLIEKIQIEKNNTPHFKAAFFIGLKNTKDSTNTFKNLPQVCELIYCLDTDERDLLSGDCLKKNLVDLFKNKSNIEIETIKLDSNNFVNLLTQLSDQGYTHLVFCGSFMIISHLCSINDKMLTLIKDNLKL